MIDGEEYPDETWDAKEILNKLNQVSQRGFSGLDDKPKERNILLACLKILKIARIDRELTADLMGALFGLVNVYGYKEPYESLSVEIIHNYVENDRTAYKMLLNQLATTKSDDQLHCFIKIIKWLGPEEQTDCIKTLMDNLMTKEYFSNIHFEFAKLFKDICNDNKNSIEILIPYLNSEDHRTILYRSLIIASEIPDTNLSDKVIDIGKKALLGWYDGSTDGILQYVCKFFENSKDKLGFSILLEILQKKPSQEVSRALVALADEETANKIIDFLEKSKNDNSISYALSALESFDGNYIDISRLLSIPYLLNFYSSRLNFIVIKTGKLAKKKLIELAKSNDKNLYEFAINCLREIGISLDEISKIFDINPMLQIYDYFFGKDYPLDSLNLQDKGGEIKGNKPQVFDFLLQNTLSALGFITLYVDKEGIDLIAFYPKNLYLLIIGCTTGVLKTDLQSLNLGVRNLTNSKPELTNKLKIIPVVIASKDFSIHHSDLEYTKENNMCILTRSDLKKLVEMLKTNRDTNYLIEFIDSKIRI